MFLALFNVESHEVNYVGQALAAQMPSKGEVIPRVFVHETDGLTGHVTMAVQTPEPLTLHQRQFLVSCGFHFDVIFDEE